MAGRYCGENGDTRGNLRLTSAGAGACLSPVISLHRALSPRFAGKGRVAQRESTTLTS